MNYQEAIRLLHPDTTEEAIAEIEYYGGFKGYEKAMQAINEACILACEALEKRVPKKPNLSMNEQSGMFVDYADGHGEYKTQFNNWWRCPCCSSVVGQMVVVHGRKHNQRKKKHCEECGQAIDWKNGEENR